MNTKKLLAALVSVIIPLSLFASSGDVNGDGFINKADIEAIIDVIMGKASTISFDAADVNKDGEVNVSDMVSIVNLIEGRQAIGPEDEKEVVLRKVERLDSRVSELIVGTTSASDLMPNIEEINNMDGVKEATIEDDALVVELDCGVKLAWLYVNSSYNQDNAEHSQYATTRMFSRAEAAAENAELMEKDAKMCIINAVPEDKEITNDFTLTMFSELSKTYSKAGYSVTPVNGESFNREFIKKELSDYQFIVLLAHGEYFNGQHWIITGERMSFGAIYDIRMKEGNDCVLVRPVGDDKTMQWWEKYKLYYVSVSEKYLRKYLGCFNPNSILFAMTCQTLKRNDNLWDVLKEKGLGVFIGYNESISSTYAINAMSMFYNNLISYKESTTSKAFDAIDSSLRIYNGIRKREDEFLERYTATIGYRSQRDICLFEAEKVNDEAVVDLGLSVKWANCNLGALKPTEIGTSYSEWNDFKVLLFDNKELVERKEYQQEVGELSSTVIDPVAKKLGGNWRLPTSDEMKELVNNCTWEAVVIDDVPGFKVTGPNQNSIFFPATEGITAIDMGAFGGVMYSFGGSYFSGTYINHMQGIVFRAVVGPEILKDATPIISITDVHENSFIRPVCP